MMIVAWHAWYTKDRIYSSEEIDWSELPEIGVLSIALYEDRVTNSGQLYRQLLNGADYYFRATKNGEIIYGQASNVCLSDGTRIDEPGGLIYEIFPDAEVKFGETVSDEEYAIVMAQVIKRELVE